MSSQPRVVYLHIGPPKTATTYLQDVFWRNREVLRRRDITFPGARLVDHFLAAQEIRGMQFGGHPDPRIPGAWQRLVQRTLNSGTERVLISHELLAGASRTQIAEALGSLSGVDVHVICGARDLGRQVPAVWQENVKNGRTEPYPSYVRAVFRRGARRGSRAFWRVQDPVATLRRWGSVVPADHIHVVTLPRAGAPRTLLWERFCSVLRIDPDGFDLEVARSNSSLDLAESEVLRRVNERLASELPWPTYDRAVKQWFNDRANTAGERTRVMIPIPKRYRDAARLRAEETIAALRRSGYDIVGDLGELMPDDSSFSPRSRPDRARVLNCAVELLSAALVESASASSRSGPRDVAVASGRRLLDAASTLSERLGGRRP